MFFLLRRFFILSCFIAFLFFSSCQSRQLFFQNNKKVLFVAFTDYEEDTFNEEKKWLEKILKNSQEFEDLGFRFVSSIEEGETHPDFFIDFFSVWVFEDEGNGITISKTYFAPKENSLNGRKNTRLEDCINEKEDIVSIYEIVPPFVAIRVDGYAVDDENYSLIRSTNIKIRLTENEDKTKSEKLLVLEGFFKDIPKPLTERNPILTWISAGGDVMLGRNAGNILLNDGAVSLFGKTAEILSKSDISLINLEGPLSNRGTPAQKTYTFRFEPPMPLAYALKNAGINAVLFANNHGFDFGDIAFLDTISFLELANIGILGAGRNLEEVLTPWSFEKNSFTFNIWGLAGFPQERTGWNGLEYIATTEKAGYIHTRRGGVDILKAQLKKSENNNTINVILFHGGEEWSHSPNRQTRELYTGLVHEGADLIIGSHPHIVQGFEWIDEKIIFWSLGNFVFAGMQDTGGGDEGLLIRLGYFGKQLLYLEAFALILSGPRVDIAPERNLEGFYRKSKALAQ